MTQEPGHADLRAGHARGLDRQAASTGCWRQMTVEEKLQQVQLLSDGQITDADAEAGVGGCSR